MLILETAYPLICGCRTQQVCDGFIMHAGLWKYCFLWPLFRALPFCCGGLYCRCIAGFSCRVLYLFSGQISLRPSVFRAREPIRASSFEDAKGHKIDGRRIPYNHYLRLLVLLQPLHGMQGILTPALQQDDSMSSSRAMSLSMFISLCIYELYASICTTIHASRSP